MSRKKEKEDKRGKSEAVNKSRKRSALGHTAAFIGGIIIALGGVFLFSGQSVGKVQASSSLSGKTREPWGQIEYTTIGLERPDESFPSGEWQVPTPRWIFENTSEQELLKFFNSGDIPAQSASILTNRQYRMAIPGGWVVAPTVDAVENLPEKTRARIYNTLGANPKNALQFHPFQVETSRFEDWLEASGLPEDMKKLVRRVSYTKGDHTCIADFEVIESKGNLEQRKQFAKLISRSEGLYMKLRITPESDLKALEEYWGRGGRIHAMRPFLQAAARVPGGTTIGVTFLFPELARMRLYTYPNVLPGQTSHEDCFWTALNFFNAVPDNRFTNGEVIRATIKNDYVEVKTNWAFGDVVVVVNGMGAATHMCVYVADDVVFTKNGVDVLEPWTLMKTSSMLRRYQGENEKVTLVAYRRKGT